MIRKRYLIPSIAMVVLLTWALQTPAQDQMDSRPSAEEMAAITGQDAPKTIEEQVQDVISDDGVIVRSEDGRTVLQMEGDPDDEFTLSFTSVRDGVMAHVQLGKGGLKHRFTLVKPEGNDTPIYLDLKGPAVNGGYGVKVTLRF
jgi:hypothetical protein